MDIDGKRVMVTGASRGIGEAIARRCAAEGAHVVLVARDAARLQELAAALRATPVAADLTDARQLDGFVRRVEDEVGPLDVLVNNAGIDTSGAFSAASAAELRTLVDLNLLAPMELCRQVLPGMVQRGRGHIVNVSSLAGVASFPGLAPYAATKAGLTHFTAGLRGELRGTRVQTTVVELGPVPTDMLDRAFDYEPTRRSFQRAYRLGVLADVDRDTVATAVVDAVRRGHRHVRLPKRAAAFPLLAEAPRRITELMLLGVPNR